MAKRARIRSSAVDEQALPTIAIVGRPNVGKSTLFNRLVGSRRALVGDEPGITRDRIYGTGHWRGRDLRIVDTGGILPADKELMPTEIFRQARVALDEADAIVMVVDGRAELTAPDRDLALLLLRSGKPLFLAVNKVDTPELEPYVESYRELGIEELHPISAEHGLGVAELLESVFDVLPEAPEIPNREDPEDAEEYGVVADAVLAEDRRPTTDDAFANREVRVAIIGRPNVGKSTLLNRLTGTARAIVSPVPGTTRDAVDELIQRDGRSLRFIDTAGIRRKGKTELMAEKLAVVMARKHLEAADIALLMIDATEGVTALDANIAGYAHESGRSVIVVVNKWDLLTEAVRTQSSKESRRAAVRAGRPMDRRSLTVMAAQQQRADPDLYEKQTRTSLKFLSYAPMVFISAATGKNVEKIFSLIERVAAERRKRIPTGEMNRFLERVDFERAHVPVSRRVRILYMTQASTSPPTFVLFVDREVKLHFSYERFVENQIRKAFGFEGTPIRLVTRARKSKN